jgi:putative transposase
MKRADPGLRTMAVCQTPGGGSIPMQGECWDNAVAESFFATIKRELINSRAWPTRAELRSAVFEYIEG